MAFQFNPPEGYRNVTVFSTKPANETAFRDQMMSLLDQIVTEMNTGANSAIGSSGMERQAVINGNMDIVQSGTMFSNPDGIYTLDQYLISFNPDGGTLPTTITHQQAQTTGEEVPDSKNFYRIVLSGAGSAFGVNASYAMFQRIENATRFLCGAGKKITLSFYARSSIAGKKVGLGFAQRYGTGGAPSASEVLIGQVITLTSNWTRYTVPINTNTLNGKTFGTNNDDYLQAGFYHMWGTAIGNTNFGVATSEGFSGSGTIDITQVQMNSGDTALPFQPPTFEQELLRCMRYYEKSYDYAIAPGTSSSLGYLMVGVASNVNTVESTIPFKVRKRIDPTVITYHSDGTASSVGKTVSDTKVNGVTYSRVGQTGIGRISAVSGFAAGDVVLAHWAADARL